MVRFPCVLAPGTPCGSNSASPADRHDGSASADEVQNGNDEAPICTPAPGQAPVCPASSDSSAGTDGVGLPPGQSGKNHRQSRGRGHGAHASRANGKAQGRGNGNSQGTGSSQGQAIGGGANGNASTPAAPDDPDNCAPLSTAAPAITSPAAPPAPLAAPTFGRFAVLGTQQTAGPAACLAAPRHLRVHAGETTLVTVGVRISGQQIQGALVRVLAPGVRIVKRTGRTGTLTFRVTPQRSGQLIIQSDACFGAVRSSVLAAHRSTRVAPAAFTG
jgi:hypothetical protein